MSGATEAFARVRVDAFLKDAGWDLIDISIALRDALLWVLKRLSLLGDASQQDPHTQHVVAFDAAETARALKRANFEFDETEQAPKVGGSA